MVIREASAADAAGIAVIYNDAVARTTAIFNDHQVDVKDREDWMATRQQAGFPVLVALCDGAVAGYASYGPWRPHDGFCLTAEHSVYVAQAARGRGLALALMQQLIARARADGLHVLVAAIEAGNQPSLALHRRLGFSETALMREVAQKFGRWLDLQFMELRLDERPSP
nr:GNAT family N-acetyltransferase [Pseudogemmobacter faecipullorum]